VDARKYYEIFHEISANPMPFFCEVSSESVAAMLHSESHLVQMPYVSRTKLEALFECRTSTREFSGEPITEKDFLRLAWATYGKLKRSTTYPESTIGLGTIPSGGALYPLRLYGIAMKIPTFKENGVYKFSSRGALYLRSSDTEELVQIFGENPKSFTIEYTAAILIIACDFEQTTQKYSNRGYRYAFLEAGHAAQNAYLWCAEQGLGIVEVAGFNDKNLAKTLQLPYPKQAPLITLVIGRKKN
jgi:SagB-type dehydrogenase family enzyme